MASKRPRTVMTVAERVKCIRLSEAGHKVKSIQETLGVGKTQIYETLKNKASILARYESGSLPAHRKLLVARRTRFGAVNDRVLEWFLCCRAKNFPLTGPLIREKASSIAKSMGIDDFEASGGWLQKFVARHQLTNSILCGEGGELSGLIEGYSANNIFNCDETGLFFRTLPSRSYVSKRESAKNGKLAKDRITVLLASSMAGEKLRPLVIGKSANPRCFTKDYKQQMRVTYEANRKAWMTSEIFLKWLHQLNNKMVIQNRKILLFMDNCGAHVPATLSNMKIIFFPPNTTSHLQPMDAGVIQNVKLQYRKSMLKSILLNMDECNKASDLVKKITVRDAIEWIEAAWMKLESSTISKCFSKCGFSHTDAITHDAEGEDIDETDLIPLRQIIPDLTNQDLLNVDCDLAVTKDYTATEITELLEQTTNVIESEEEDDLSGSTDNKHGSYITTGILIYLPNQNTTKGANLKPSESNKEDNYKQMLKKKTKKKVN
uniref:HTH CENPB-type domain-containing protein n=1 Tax=Hippocampus comes TaxID=109280 RepID=A0A3Q2XZU1_HIPCM